MQVIKNFVAHGICFQVAWVFRGIYLTFKTGVVDLVMKIKTRRHLGNGQHLMKTRTKKQIQKTLQMWVEILPKQLARTLKRQGRGRLESACGPLTPTNKRRKWIIIY